MTYLGEPPLQMECCQLVEPSISAAVEECDVDHAVVAALGGKTTMLI